MRRQTGLLITLIAMLFSTSFARADEGQWPFNHLPREQLSRDYGFRPDAAWLESLQTATVRLGTGCSGSFVSDDGLVITAEHCTRRCLRQLSTAGNDLVGPGFLAVSRDRERHCPAGEISQLLGMHDVTRQVEAATAGKIGNAYIDALNGEKAKIQSACADAPDIRCEIVLLYQGGVYEAYKYRRFDDVRLVFAPESQIAFFGGDPDNYNFPRYAFDIGLMRVYVAGKPYHPLHHLRLARSGPREGDIVFVSGHPSLTSRALTMAQLGFERDVDLIDTIAYLSEQRGLLTAFADSDAADETQVAPILFGIENDLKVYKGQYQALSRPEIWARKARAEDSLRARVNADPNLRKAAGAAWDRIAQAVDARRLLYRRYVMLEEGRAFQSALFVHARNLLRFAEEARKPSGERLPEYSDANIPELRQTLLGTTPISPRLEIEQLAWSLTKMREAFSPDDPLVRNILGNDTPRSVAERLVAGTKLSDPNARARILNGGEGAVEAAHDPMIAFAAKVDAPSRAIRREYEARVDAPLSRSAAEIARARFALDGFALFPDAGGTLRLSFGRATGWIEPDGHRVSFATDLAGLFRRVTGADPFRLPRSWAAAEANLDPHTHLNFVSTSDTVGGDSGAPVVDRAGELVGVHFDGNSYATGREYVDDETFDRAIGVDVDAIRTALGKVYGARSLLSELESDEAPGKPGHER